MPDVVPLHTPAFRLGEMVDLSFFERHPDRRNRIRWLDMAEARQAQCLHGEAPAGRCYMVVVRLIKPGILARRFLLNGSGDGAEECCREAFERALIAGETPRSIHEDGGRAA